MRPAGDRKLIRLKSNQKGLVCLKPIVKQPTFPKNIVFCALFVLVIGFTGANAQQPAVDTDIIYEVYLAKANADGEAGDVVEEFWVNDVPIFCVVELTEGDPVTVTLSFVAANVPGVRKDSKVVTSVYTTKQGETRVNFSGRPLKTWVAGRYRADILINGTLRKSVEFDIKKPVSVPAASKFSPTPTPPKRSRGRRKPL